jgi:signal transduction histidine kinase
LEQLRRLIEISRALNSTLSLRPLLYKIVETAQELTETSACSILLVDRKSGQLHFEAATGDEGYRMRSIIVPMEGSVAGRVVRTGEIVVIQDTQEEPRFYRDADRQSDFNTRSILAVPMTARSKVIGVLEALNKHNGARFTDEDVDLLSVLGDQAAVAVQNALLFQQSDLIAEIVHEMRTPLTAIISYADLLLWPQTDMSQVSQFAEIVRREAERLNEMANTFLDLARLESGRASLARDPVDMVTLVNMACNVLLPQADAKQVTLTPDVPSVLPVVLGDAQRLHQVLLNLIGNAVKFCSAGDEVTVAARRDAHELLVEIRDTGPGIPQDSLPHIFERFYRSPNEEGQSSGVGLGLSISKGIVDAHGGLIEVSSEVGVGTTFTCRLPLQEQPQS